VHRLRRLRAILNPPHQRAINGGRELTLAAAVLPGDGYPGFGVSPLDAVTEWSIGTDE